MKKMTIFLVSLWVAATWFVAPTLGQDRKTMTIGAYTAPNTPWDENWKDVTAAFEANTHLGLDLELLVRGETGSSEERLNSLRRNRLQFVSAPLGSGAAMVPELAVLQLPFLFSSTSEADFVLDEYALPKFQEVFATKGIAFLRWTEAGSNHLFGDRPFLTPESLQGFPMRVQTTKSSSVYFEALKADAVYLTSNDILPSLQTGMIDGGEAVTIFYWMTGIYKEAPHFTMTGHAIEPSSILLNKPFWDSLNDEQQVLVSTAYPGPMEARNRVREWMARVEDDLPDLGVMLHRLNEEQRWVWAAHAESSYPAIIESIGGEAPAIYDLVREGQAAYARKQDQDT